MNMSGGSGNTTTSGITYPKWAEYAIKEYFMDAIALSMTAYNTTYDTTANYKAYKGAFVPSITFSYPAGTNFGGFTYACQDANEVAGINGIAARAASGGDTTTSIYKARTLVNANAVGTNIAQNTNAVGAFTAKRLIALQEFDEATLPNLAHSANIVGRYGGSAHAFMQYREAENIMRKFLDDGVEIVYSDHKEARNMQEGALSLALGFAAESIRDIEMLHLAGLYRREFTQGWYDDAHKTYIDIEQLKVDKHGIMGNAIKMMRGTARTSITPYKRPSDMTQIAGLALAGMSLAGKGKDPTAPAGPDNAYSPIFSKQAEKYDPMKAISGYTTDVTDWSKNSEKSFGFGTTL